MLPAIFLLAGIFLLWRSEYAARWRRSWTGWDWVGFVTLVVGAVVIVSAVLGHRSLEWNYATRLYKGRMLDLSLNAAGALTIGLGVLPWSQDWRSSGVHRTNRCRMRFASFAACCSPRSSASASTPR